MYSEHFIAVFKKMHRIDETLNGWKGRKPLFSSVRANTNDN